VFLLLCNVFQAVAAFLSRLGMSEDEFIKRKELVDLVTAYHVIPGDYYIIC
jgi:hypothetical protein